MTSNYSKELENLHETEKKLKKFVDVLDNLNDIDDKTKALWREIYENATTDRESAFMLYTDLYREVKGKPANHNIHGLQMAKYLERMCKSNDQLLRLAEILERATRESTEINSDDVFDEINNIVEN